MPNKRALISVLILWMFFMPLNKGIAGLNTGAWPMLGHDTRHTGQSEYTEKAFGELKWRYQTGNGVSSSPAIASDGSVYVGSRDNYLYALNPDGTLKWCYQTGGSVYSSPAIASDGTVYVGSGDNYLYALNPDGTLKWRYQTDGPIYYPSPAIASDGTVYVASNDYNLYALNPDGTLKWRHRTGYVVYSSPAIASDGTVYVGSYDKYLYALNSDGTSKWRYQTGGWVSSSPAIASDGTVYVGSDDYNLYALNPDGTLKWCYQTGSSIFIASPTIASDGTVYVGSGDKYLYALNPDGTLKWRYQTGSSISSSSAIGSDGTVYIGSRDNYLYALNPDGSLKWRYQTGDDIYNSSPAIGSDGTLYVGSNDNYLYAFNLGNKGVITGIIKDYATGSLLANVNVSAGGLTAQTDDNGYYYLVALTPGTYDLTFAKSGFFSLTVSAVRINAGEATIRDVSLYPLMQYTGEDKYFVEVSKVFTLTLPATGGSGTYTYSIISGQLPSGLTLNTSTGQITGTPTTTGTYEFTFRINDGKGQIIDKTFRLEIHAPSWPMRGHDIRHTGQSEYTEKAFGALKWRYQTGSSVNSPPAIGSDGTVYVGSDDNYLYALNPDGTLKWRYLTGDDVISSPAIASDGTVYAGSNDNYLYALNPDGTLKWRYQTGSYQARSVIIISSPAIGSDGTVYVGSDDNYLYALNPDGTLKWRYQTGDRIHSSPAIGSDGTVYVGSYDCYLYALNPDGTLKWRYLTGDDVISSPAIASDGTVYVGGTFIFYALNPDGSRKWGYGTGGYVLSSPAIGSDGTVYVGSSDCYLYALNPDRTLKWRYLTGGFVFSSPAIGSDGTVYVGSEEGYYLYALNPDGTLKWRYLTGGFVYSSPAIGSDGTVYVGSQDKYLYAFRLQSQGAVYGMVRNMATGVGASVTLSAATGSNMLSGSDGNYTLIQAPGTYILTVTGAGYQTLAIPSVVVKAGDGTPLDILVPTTGTFSITRLSFVPGSVGQSYKDRAWVAGGTYPYIFSISYGTLPPGCILDAASGFITGTPTTPGSYTFAIGVRDQQNGYLEVEYTIDVTAPLAFTATALPRATKNTPYFYNLMITGGLSPYTIIKETGGLPTGLTLSSTGRLTGTPTITGSAVFTAKVTDAAGRTLFQNFPLPVDDPLSISTPNLNTGITGQPYNQTLQAAGGYGAYTWSVYSGTLPQGINLDAATGILSGTSQTAETMPLVIMAEDSVGRQAFKNLTLIVTTPLAFVTTTLPTGARNETYSEQVRVSGGLAPYQFTYTGTLPTGLSLNQTTGVISGTPTATMLTNIQITVTDSSLPTPQTATATLALRVTSTLTINSSAVLPSARLDQAISPVVLRAVGGVSPYQWSLAGGSLPLGLSLDAATGQLTGTPTAAGDYVFTITVTDSKQPAQTFTKEFIYHVSRTLIIDTNALPDGGKDVFYSYTLPVSGGRQPYAWRVKTGTLPAGLTIDAATGTIAGKPTTAASVQVTIAVTDGDTPAQTAEKTFAINISDRLFITTTSLPNGRLGQAYTANVNAALGTPPYSFAVTEGLLPKGLSMTMNAMSATISGAPTEAGTATFTVTVTDSGVPVQTITKQYTVNVYSLIDITTPTLPNALKGANYDQTIAVTGGLPPYTWSVSAGQLPAGLSLDSATGKITGTPSWDPGMSAEFTIRVTDAGTPALPVQKQFVTYVLDPMTITSNEIQGALQQADYSATLAGFGGLSPFSWSVSQGALPEGMIINGSSGTISGKSAVCGEFDFTIRLTDAGAIPLVVDKAFHLSVLCSNDYKLTGTICPGGTGPLSYFGTGCTTESDIKVKLSGAASREVTTTAGGNYVFEHLPGGDYTVTPVKPSFGFNPDSQMLQISRDTTFDFTLFKLWGDIDGDSRLTMGDAILGLKILSGMKDAPTPYPEGSRGGKISLQDVIYIMQSVAGMR